jgi:hypothetical protein
MCTRGMEGSAVRRDHRGRGGVGRDDGLDRAEGSRGGIAGAKEMQRRGAVFVTGRGSSRGVEVEKMGNGGGVEGIGAACGEEGGVVSG